MNAEPFSSGEREEFSGRPLMWCLYYICIRATSELLRVVTRASKGTYFHVFEGWRHK